MAILTDTLAITIISRGRYDSWVVSHYFEELASHARFFRDVMMGMAQVAIYGSQINIDIPGAEDIVAQIIERRDRMKLNMKEWAEMILDLPEPPLS